jgi:hypothetical protein
MNLTLRQSRQSMSPAWPSPTGALAGATFGSSGVTNSKELRLVAFLVSAAKIAVFPVSSPSQSRQSSYIRSPTISPVASIHLGGHGMEFIRWLNGSSGHP